MKLNWHMLTTALPTMSYKFLIKLGLIVLVSLSLWAFVVVVGMR